MPLFLIANTLFVVFITYALLQWTGQNREEADLLFDLVPVRVVMVLVVSFLVSAILMTVWGRVGDWQPPAEAIARINVICTVGSLGAAPEAFVGSIFFSIPFLVEDGVFDIADYFLSFRLGYFPVFFLVNTAFVLLMIAALVYWAGPQDVRASRPILGIVPRRLVGIALVSFLTAGVLMTMWGRVGSWEAPVTAIARVSVVWTVASFGAALGDILPGESSGDDINDELAERSEGLVRDGRA